MSMPITGKSPVAIPEAAVEAAARAYRDQQSEMGYPEWDALPEWGQEMRLNHMRAALEAAAPFIEAQAWDAGYDTGLTHDFEATTQPQNPHSKEYK